MKTGRPTTKPGRKRVTFNLPPEDMEKLKRIAQAQGISASELLHQTIEKLAREKMNYEAESETTDNRLLGIARAMHGELCDCDDRNCNTVNDIYSWLASGDNETLTEADTPELVKEWREYYGIG